MSPQSEDIYQLLLKGKSLTARNIGKKLDIFPNTVYRAVKPLVAFGLVEQVDTYPVSFQAKSIETAIHSYTMSARTNLMRKFFSINDIKSNSFTDSLDVSFIQNREGLLNYSNDDINKAKISVYHIVSGLEVPAESMLALKNAVERNVYIKFLVQQLDEVNKKILQNWQKIGVQIKYFPSMEARIIIIDEQIAYITSYNPNRKNEATGVRFNYPPIAKLMSEIFWQRWGMGKKIDEI